jgi:hypothetical protein
MHAHYYLKGSVRRKLRWLINGFNRQLLLYCLGVYIYFVEAHMIVVFTTAFVPLIREYVCGEIRQYLSLE